jgi:alanyl-tRNA synthetase
MSRNLQSTFKGYETLETNARVLAIIQEGKEVQEAQAPGEVEVAVSETPFYAESGGQIGDQGTISWDQGRLSVKETFSLPNGLILQRGKMEAGTLALGTEVRCRVSTAWRTPTARNHTATHLLHGALRRILGDQVKQAGSLVSPSRLRFDFSHYAALSSREIQSVEVLVNEQIQRNLPVDTRVMAYDQARASGALALFEERYGDQVRLVQVGDFSRELCGGTHTQRTGDIGFFKIISESSVAAGIRRLEALTGQEALQWVQGQEARIKSLSELLKSTPEELVARVERLLGQQKDLERSIVRLQKELLSGGGIDSLLSRVRVVDGVQVLAAPVAADEARVLRELADTLRDRLGSGIVVLGGKKDDKVLLVAVVTKDLIPRYQAGKIIKRLARALGGDGGGRPDMAQAGGNRPELLEKVLEQVDDWLRPPEGAA